VKKVLRHALWLTLALTTSAGCTSGASTIDGGRPSERNVASISEPKSTNWRNINEITSPKSAARSKDKPLAAGFRQPAKDFSNLIEQQLSRRGTQLTQSDRDPIEAAYTYLLAGGESGASESWQNDRTRSSGTLRLSRFGDLKGNASQCAEVQHQHRFHRPTGKTYRLEGTIKLCRNLNSQWTEEAVVWRRSGDDLS
jgi:hypothetical protein